MYFGGYNKIFSWEVDDEVIRLREIQICTTPEKLRKIGKFFLDTANDMDHWGDDIGGRHLIFEVSEFDKEGEPDIELVRKANEKV